MLGSAVDRSAGHRAARRGLRVGSTGVAQVRGAGEPSNGVTVEQAGILRPHAEYERVTSIELFYDLVSVFAITQLSDRLVADSTAKAAVQTGLLFVMVWLLWVYTTWVTNFLDPDRPSVRLVLLLLMLASLVFSGARHRGLLRGDADRSVGVRRHGHARHRPREELPADPVVVRGERDARGPRRTRCRI
jgi:hypothetical protein